MIVPKPPTFTPIKSIFGSFAKLDSITVAGTFETIWESDTEIKYSYLSTKFSTKHLKV